MDAARRFDLRERISDGVSAEVHRAYDRELDRDVVIRILREGLDDEYVERFQRAAEDSVDVRHANVVAVLDHGVIDGRPFLVRELVEGSTLDDLLARRGPLSEEEARSLAAQIATGLGAAHARGLLHRDLSAGSVIATPDSTAKVADFSMPGVPRHPAPEQTSGRQIDERTDVYGLGAVLYQMLTGHVPR
ncbi:MAG TPA: serine/threonine-protein kinase, partial [Candidatus Limnocylindria bacterium]